LLQLALAADSIAKEPAEGENIPVGVSDSLSAVESTDKVSDADSCTPPISEQETREGENDQSETVLPKLDSCSDDK